MMPRSKRGPALFDLLNADVADAPEALKVPGWGGEDAHSPRATTAKGRPDRTVRGSPQVGRAPAGSSAGQRGSGAPLIELDGDRIRISLTSVAAAIAVFAAAVVMLGAFELGRRNGDSKGFRRGYATGRASYAAEAVSEIEAARRLPPATNVVSSLLKEADAEATPGSSDAGQPPSNAKTTEWIRDYTYIVVQEFVRDHSEDASLAQEYLARRGVSTELVRYSSGAVQLITKQGFDRRDPTQRRMADALLKKVHAIGAEYFSSAGGGYRLEGYFKALKGDTW